ncbi:LOW QUALITY PROTEIN: arf-GAP domain and FG repeat-containing protein 1b [Anguilla anguilla]|uniref:LOW QUALITY PROTEIN: arf-GAP domain and FG repeat-containing protein 1b n=1 Tax=Anguilla anguilla TaxID=7936 RepID=UPI0015AF2937|nr:LOW QUALITY PROTEIN: arf-GAP domain and FG repeat-containing protein 1b [Anguilla anguilla]
MAVNAKRKQEEKHLKMLREMTSLPPNRKCFDCDQRGPTYANMTVGSFVCTTCSGILCLQRRVALMPRPSRPSRPRRRKFDLLSDLGGDIFAAPPSQAAGANSFANFAVSTTNRCVCVCVCVRACACVRSVPGGGVPNMAAPPPAPAGAAAAQPQAVMVGGDRYAALAELDSVFSVSSSSSSPAAGTAPPGSVYGAAAGIAPAPAQQVLPSMPQGFGAGPSTNPFVAAAVAPATAPTNPFQTNGKAVAAAAPFGTGSMSMPAGFGNSAAFNLPTSFSGTFQQPIPGQGPFPQPPAYPLHPNGAGCAPYGHAKPVVTPFGQVMSGPGVSSNPFMAGAPAGQYPGGSSSTNPFL